MSQIEILFDGPPGPVPGRFIEVNDAETGASISWGEWRDNGDGTWSLIGPANPLLLTLERIAVSLERLTFPQRWVTEPGKTLVNVTVHGDDEETFIEVDEIFMGLG